MYLHKIYQGKLYTFLFVMGLLFSAVLPTQSHASNLSKVKVVTSFSILGDVVKNVGGDHIDVKSIVGPNGDTHIYEPTPDDSILISGADIIFINGLKFETWFDRLVEASGFSGPVVTASQGITPHNMIDIQYSDAVVPDPHVWGNVKYVMMWTKTILDALIKFDPKNEKAYQDNAEQYLKELAELDKWIRSQFSGVPPKDCKVITAHDAFNYYELAYGIVFLSPQGMSTVDEPSASEIVGLIQQIQKEGIKTIFVENISNQKLIQQISNETGAKIGGTLYSDALSPIGEPGDTYIKMMMHNTKYIRGALTCSKKQDSELSE